MSSFQNSMTPAITPLSLTPTAMPLVFYTAVAWQKIQYFIRHCDKEIAWFGVVEELENGDYLIEDVYLPNQTVTGASVDVEANQVAALAIELMDKGVDPSTLRYHGHSHVNMHVAPSGTDQEHLQDYLEHADWFIRGIYNKKGDSKVDVFDKRTGLIYQCCTTEIWELAQTAEFYDELKSQLAQRVQHPKYPKTQIVTPSQLKQMPHYNKDFSWPRQLRPEAIDDATLEDLTDPFFVQAGY